jgi:hypothetical protein
VLTIIVAESAESENIPAASDEIKKLFCAATCHHFYCRCSNSDSSPSLERILSNDYLSGKVWLYPSVDELVLRVTPISTSIDSVVSVRVFLSMLSVITSAIGGVDLLLHLLSRSLAARYEVCCKAWHGQGNWLHRKDDRPVGTPNEEAVRTEFSDQ